jgi:putative DNA primase/helicase
MKTRQERRARAANTGHGNEDGNNGKNAEVPSQSQSATKPWYPAASLWIPRNHMELGLGLPCTKALSEPFWSRLYARQHWIIYEPDEKRFYRYIDSTGAWDSFDVESLRKDLVEGIEAAAAIWNSAPMRYLCTERNLRGMIELLKGEVHSRGFFANPPRHCIHAANCMIRFDSKGNYQREDFSPEFRSRAPSPFKYVDDARCSEFLEKMLGHLGEDTRLLIQKCTGQCLLGFNHSQTILLLNGVADSSKTELIRVIAGLVGQHNVEEMRTHFLSERFEIGRFVGKTLLTGADVPADFLSTKAAHNLKKLVGGDILTGEIKGSNRLLSMLGHFNTIVGSNSTLLVRLEGDLGAWLKRLLIADFTHRFNGDKVENIHEMLLREEGSGILKWALDGARMLLADLREAGRIRLTDRQRGLVENLLMESDSLQLYLRGELVKTESADDTLTTDELYTGYAAFCVNRTWSVPAKAAVEKLIPTLMTQTWSLTKSHDLERPGSKSLRGYHYIRFRKPDDPDEG